MRGHHRKMGLFAAVKSCFSNYTNFRGRAGRGEFWNWVLFVVFLSILPSIADSIYGMFVVTGPVAALIFLPTLAVLARRLNDVGYSRWWVLIALSGVGVLLLAVWCVKESVHGDDIYAAAAGVAAPQVAPTQNEGQEKYE